MDAADVPGETVIDPDTSTVVPAWIAAFSAALAPDHTLVAVVIVGLDVVSHIT
jgi:hypothetical protein